MQLKSTVTPRSGLRFAGAGTAFHNTICEMLDDAELFANFEWEEINALSKFVTAHEADAGHDLRRNAAWVAGVRVWTRATRMRLTPPAGRRGGPAPPGRAGHRSRPHAGCR